MSNYTHHNQSCLEWVSQAKKWLVMSIHPLVMSIHVNTCQYMPIHRTLEWSSHISIVHLMNVYSTHLVMNESSFEWVSRSSYFLWRKYAEQLGTTRGTIWQSIWQDNMTMHNMTMHNMTMQVDNQGTILFATCVTVRERTSPRDTRIGAGNASHYSHPGFALERTHSTRWGSFEKRWGCVMRLCDEAVWWGCVMRLFWKSGHDQGHNSVGCVCR